MNNELIRFLSYSGLDVITHIFGGATRKGGNSDFVVVFGHFMSL